MPRLNIRITSLLVLSFCSFLPAMGQKQAAPKIDTIITVFKNIPHKDGYEVAGRIMNIPTTVAAGLDNRRIRIIGSNSSYPKKTQDMDSVDTKKDNIIQGRYEVVPDEKDSTGKKMKTILVAGGATFTISSVALWNAKKEDWQVVYKPSPAKN